MMNIANDNTSAAVRSKDVRQAAMRRYLIYQKAVKAREGIERRKLTKPPLNTKKQTVVNAMK